MLGIKIIKAEVEEMKKHNQLLSEIAMELKSRGNRIEELEKENCKLKENLKIIQERFDKEENKRLEYLEILGEFDYVRNEFALEHNCKDLQSMIDTVEKKIQEIFKDFLEEKYVMAFDELTYENIPWAMEQITLKMSEWLEKLREQDDDISILKEVRDGIQQELDDYKKDITPVNLRSDENE